MMRKFTEREVPISGAIAERGNSLAKARRKRAGESGYTLLIVVFLLFAFALSLSVAVPKIRKSLQRDQEVETQQRGKQYIRAIRLYYHKFNTFPLTIDALVKQNNMRFLRKKYKDPTTGKEEWKLIHYGQAKTQSLGFFGKPISGVGGLGGGGIGPINAGNGSVFGNNPTDPNSTQNTTDQNGQQGSTTQSGTGTSTQSGTGQSGFGQSGFGQSGQGGFGQSGFGQSGFGQSGQSGFGSSSNGSTGQTFGGGGIIGVEPSSPKATTIVYRKKSHYNEWEFIYDPALERYYESGAAGLPNGQQNGAFGNALGGSSGSGVGGGGFGGSGSSGGFGGGNGNSGSGGNSGGSGVQSNPNQ